MKAETQHLDFLISQYVDGSLEGAGKKSVEQKMLSDPGARKLYAEHREVQDILDDYGSRIPMINWGEFEKQLDGRLEVEAREKQRASRFRRRMKPVAAAAALFIAVSLGYGWHALSQAKTPGNPTIAMTAPMVQPQTVVVFPESIAATKASYIGFGVNEAAATTPASGTVEGFAFGAPPEQVALQALEANIGYGFGNLPGSMTPQTGPARGSAVGSAVTPLPMDDGEMLR